jgi:hypothetical protein
MVQLNPLTYPTPELRVALGAKKLVEPFTACIPDQAPGVDVCRGAAGDCPDVVGSGVAVHASRCPFDSINRAHSIVV